MFCLVLYCVLIVGLILSFLGGLGSIPKFICDDLPDTVGLLFRDDRFINMFLKDDKWKYENGKITISDINGDLDLLGVVDNYFGSCEYNEAPLYKLIYLECLQ